MKKWFVLSFVLMALVFAAGCDDNFTANAYKALGTAATAYDTSMKVAADLYKQDLISDEEKAAIIEFGTAYRQAHRTAVNALAAYEKTRQAGDREKARVALAEYSKIFDELMAYLRPLLMRQEMMMRR